MPTYSLSTRAFSLLVSKWTGSSWEIIDVEVRIAISEIGSSMIAGRSRMIFGDWRPEQRLDAVTSSFARPPDRLEATSNPYLDAFSAGPQGGKLSFTHSAFSPHHHAFWASPSARNGKRLGILSFTPSSAPSSTSAISPTPSFSLEAPKFTLGTLSQSS